MARHAEHFEWLEPSAGTFAFPRLRAGGQEQPHTVMMTAVARHVQRCGPMLAWLIDGGAGSEEHGDGIQGQLDARHHQHDGV